MGQIRIGIFDSGVGGLTVYQEIKKCLKNNPLVYFSDQKNVPYGLKSQRQIRRLTVDAIKLLKNADSDVVVIACNTATTGGVEYYRKKFPGLPIVGVVPPVKPAARLSKSKKIVILSTTATAQSPYQKRLMRQFAANCQVFNFGCPQLVKLTERGEVKGPKVEAVLKNFLAKPLKKGADVIGLGCTHFPFLKGVIRKIGGNKVKIIDTRHAVAQQVVRIVSRLEKLTQTMALEVGRESFYTSGDPKKVSQIASKLLQRKIRFVWVQPKS